MHMLTAGSLASFCCIGWRRLHGFLSLHFPLLYVFNMAVARYSVCCKKKRKKKSVFC